MLLANDRYCARAQTMNLIDLAPTFLELIDCAKPPSMRGTSAFQLSTERLRNGPQGAVVEAGVLS